MARDGQRVELNAYGVLVRTGHTGGRCSGEPLKAQGYITAAGCSANADTLCGTCDVSCAACSGPTALARRR